MGEEDIGATSAHPDAELDEAVRIAIEAGQILLSYFNTDRVDVRAKGPRDVVTAADIAAENQVMSRLQRAFPRDGIVAEEGGRVDSLGGRRWYVDPLDGTLNYSRGLPLWCVSIALFEGERPVLGVVHDPIRAETFYTTRGRGARCGERTIEVTDPKSLSDACVHVTIDFNESSRLEGIEDVRHVAPRVLRTRNIGSAALALAYVAAGRFDAMIHRSANTWDYAAGVALVEAAGGVVTDMSGEPFSEATRSMVAAASPLIHRELLALVRSRTSA